MKYDKCHIFRKRSKLTLRTQIIGMSVIYLLISISIFVAVAFFIAFIVAVRSGQYDDDYTPSVRMLFDDEIKPQKEIQTTEEKQI